MKVNVSIPALGESVSQATLSRWLKADGDIVALDEPLCELETDKANVDLPSPSAGRLSRKRNEGDTLAVGDVVAEIDSDAATGAGKAQEKPKAKEDKPAATPRHEPQTVSPAPSASAPTPSSFAMTPPAASVTDIGPSRTVDPMTVKPVDGARRVPMSRIRRTIAERLLAAKHDTAMLTTFNEIDMTAVEGIRARNQEAFQAAHGVKLGLLSFFARAVSAAIREFPVINAALDGDDVLYYDDVHLGVAVSTDRGLVVPVIRNVNRMSLATIESEIKRVATAARSGKLGFAELSGGTFTITNGGVFGSMLSTPILNPPQSAILGLHATQRRPIAVGDKVEIRPMMYVALSYDHRLIDGRESVSFLVKVKQFMEDPARLVLDM